ncbi:membrane hypothetical protein [uncultured Pleomorphomonas sp.]|uniref:O-antigen ligase-related domain-containing protein n=1 Tax=uncultured Pleomorphomonas sp. TaxID=442121 RepID=A0A212LJJ1_9HYPH|nr:O-antigen ligase family protein [uncultured Pleomorphomonas sp.]SCM77657.1 membrane hypothetical protein [uncultured Pleomorphomonas sp.]
MAKLQNILLYFLIFTLPFNGLRPILDVGELSREGFFYGSLIYIIFTIPIIAQSHGELSRAIGRIFRIQYIYLFLIIISFMLNIESAYNNVYSERNGIERFFLSFSTYIYYFSLSCILAFHAIRLGVDRFLEQISRAFVALSCFLIVICSFEIISWYSEPARFILVEFRSLFALNPERTIFRLSGVSLEPSFNAFALLACVPWTALRAYTSQRKIFYALTALLVLLCLMSGARTAYVGLMAMAVIFFLYKGFLKKALPGGLDGAIFVLGMFVVGLLPPFLSFTYINPESTTSNITRAYLMRNAIDAGLDSFSGQGFGQVTFYVVQRASSIIQYSWELRDYFYGSRYGVLPPLFSWYARTFGEFGVVGYMVLAVGFSRVASKIFAVGHQTEGTLPRSLFFLSAVFLSQFLAMAFSIESIRVPQFWLTSIFAALLFILSNNRRARLPNGDF